MEMAPGGIPLAEGARDRDGLEMDVMHVRLGPVLPHWPADLLIEAAVQGDVIVEATGRSIGIPSAAHDQSRELGSDGLSADQAARVWHWDNLAHMLALLGWQDAAARARACRNDVLGSPTSGAVDQRGERLGRRITRSRTVRWSLRNVGHLSAADCARLGVPMSMAGDSYARLITMVDRCLDPAGSSAAPADTGSTVPEVAGQPARADAASPDVVSPDVVSPDVAAIAGALVGVDLAVARLVVASLDLSPTRAHSQEVDHG
ncbi:MAG: hypothetical protein WA962_08440 [Ornithinimicrobium sp.]